MKRYTKRVELAIKNKTCATAASTTLPFFLSKGDYAGWRDLFKSGGGGNSYKGAVSLIRIYDRALSEDEMMAVYHGSDGAIVSVGSENGGTGEFAATASDAAAVYEPMAMPMSRMLGVLTEAAPSTTFKFPMQPEMENLPMVLRLVAMPDGVGSAAEVALSVNGVHACSRSFADASAKEFHISARRMTRDGDGYVTMTLARTGDVSGALRFDALKLFGSWQLGLADGKNTDWCFGEGSSFSYATVEESKMLWGVVGWPYNVKSIFNTLYGQKNEGNGGTFYFPLQNIAFYVSPEIAATCSSRFSLRNSNGPAANAKVDVYVNGVLRGSSLAIPAIRSVIPVDLPPGSLQGGLNYLMVSNSAANVGGPSQYASIGIDYYKFETALPPRGVVISFR